MTFKSFVVNAGSGDMSEPDKTWYTSGLIEILRAISTEFVGQK